MKMKMTNAPQQKIDTYLAQLRQRLRRLPEHEVREIVEEIRSHIVERSAGGGNTDVDSALAALGDPSELARGYLTDALLAGAESVRSPFGILGPLFRWARLSFIGFFVLLGSLIGYWLGAIFVLCAVMKPIHPRTVGLWMLPTGPGDLNVSLQVGFANAPVNGHEVLGWWIVPLGLLAGCGLVLLTTRAALWCVRQYRSSHTPPMYLTSS